MIQLERDFVRLASTWLACRYRILHGDRLHGCRIPYDLAHDMLGELDMEQEMGLLCKEVSGGV